MRNFEERKKEVLRRSAKRIEKRRKRRRALLSSGLCLAFLVCVGLLPDGLFVSQNQSAMDEAAANDVAFDDAAVMDDAAKNDAVPAADKGITDSEKIAENTTHDVTGSCDCAAGEVGDADINDDAAAEESLSVGEVGNHGSGYEGVYLELSHIDLEAGYINAFWCNYTDQSVGFGPEYDIQRYEDGQWVSCAIDPPLDWTEERYELGPYPAELPRTCRLDRFDLSEPGLYRITSCCTVGAGDETYTLWAEFELV